jgi:hypothetical protein
MIKRGFVMITLQLARTQFITLLLLVTSLLFSSFISAKNAPTLTYGAVSFPPSSYTDPKTHKCIGITVDAVRRILANYNFKMVTVCASAKRIYKMMENGQIDLAINTAYSKHLEGLVTVVNPPFRYQKVTLYHNPDIEKNNIVAAVRGFNYDGHRSRLKQKGLIFADLLNTKKSLEFFLKNRSSYLLSYKAPIAYTLKQKNITFHDNIYEEDIGVIPMHFSINNISPIYDEIKAALDDYALKNKIKTFYNE